MYEAIYQKPDEVPLAKDIVKVPELSIYTQDFGREGDLGLTAVVDGQVVGLAWCRILDGPIKGYGFIDDQTPELAMALLPAYRGADLGTAMLKEMMSLAQASGYKNLSLSVAKDNYAVKLYMKAGFKLLREDEDDYLMIALLDGLEVVEGK